jgi:hypothetical protein
VHEGAIHRFELALYLMLQNRLYRGEIVHKGQSHPGEHPAPQGARRPSATL